MYRTPEQEREYQSLSPTDRKRYDLEVSVDSNISHDEAMQLVGVGKVLKETVKDGGKNVDTSNPETKKGILEGVARFISTHAPSVWRNVKDAFNNAISYLGNLISRGITWIEDNVIDPVIDFLDDIFG